MHIARSIKRKMQPHGIQRSLFLPERLIILESQGLQRTGPKWLSRKEQTLIIQSVRIQCKLHNASVCVCVTNSGTLCKLLPLVYRILVANRFASYSWFKQLIRPTEKSTNLTKKNSPNPSNLIYTRKIKK